MSSSVRRISTCTVRPPPDHPPRIDLASWDLAMLSTHYIQKGHLFSMPDVSCRLDDVIDHLQNSLARALLYFYPLAGRLVTERSPDGTKGLFTYINCNAGGADFVRSVADGISVADVVEPFYTPSFVKEFFCLDLAICYDGHNVPLLAIQLTELVDGFFLGFSFNHIVGDGTSFWNFVTTWAEINRGVDPISRPPVHNRWFVDGTSIPIKLPYNEPEEYILRPKAPNLREIFFHFPSESITRLREKANDENRQTGEPTISSFQTLAALVWRSITRAREFPENETVGCRLAFDNRTRFRPPLSPNYFGNTIYALYATTTAGELLSHGIGWAGAMLNRIVRSYTDVEIRAKVDKWMDEPSIYTLAMFDAQSIHIGSSPRYDMYGCDFGWGKAVAIRSGNAIKFDGKVSAFPGREGDGSVEFEICLSPENMDRLLLDREFMTVIKNKFR
ncbi:HXXXD-type acyl-transferase-like protein [Zostera marina]|uniref:HXXXD-type acyl-transferase-like protein n=1 Tax=Zostera marina TaxID=29655 RepID=A0A0K9P7E1_ZOSMR|nr:HXXXD-type acyl-transferase-like protein [Zostera marina]